MRRCPHALPSALSAGAFVRDEGTYSLKSWEGPLCSDGDINAVHDKRISFALCSKNMEERAPEYGRSGSFECARPDFGD